MKKAYFLYRLLILLLLVVSAIHPDTWKIYNNYQQVGDVYVFNDTIWALLTCSWNTNNGGVVGIPKNGPTKVFRNKFNCPLKSNYIKSFLVSSNGSQYFGTDSGLTIFEDQKWRQVTTQNSTLPNDDIYSIAEDKLGWIWVGTYRGLAKLKKDTIITTFKNNPMMISTVSNIFIDSANRKWFNNGASLCCFNDSIWTIYSEENAKKWFGPVSSLAQSQDGTIWFTGFYNSVFTFKDGIWNFFDSAVTGIPMYGANYVTIDRNNKKWFSTDSGFVLFNDTTWIKLKPDNPSIPHNFGKSTYTRNNELIVSTDSGIVTYNGTIWERIDVANSGMRVSAVASIAIDPMNRKWIGTDGGGVALFDGDKWISYDSLNGNLLDNRVVEIAVGPDSAIWFLTGTGISKYHKSSWKSWSLFGAIGRTDDWATSFYIDKRNGVWLGSYKGSVRLFDHDSLRLLKYFEMEANHAVSILQINDSIMLFGSAFFSLRSFNMNTNVFELPYTSALSGNLNQMAIDKNGQIWAGGPDGIRRINPTMWYSTSIGPIESEVWAVAIDKQDNKWFGHEYGVLKYDNQTWTPYNPVNSGIIDKFTFSIAVDSVGNIWFGTRGGLSMLSGQNSGIKRNFDLHKKTISSYFLHASFVTKDRFLISSNLNLKTINIYDLNGKCLLRSGIQNYNRSSQIISIENIHSCFHGKMLILEVNDNKNNILRTKLNYFY